MFFSPLRYTGHIIRPLPAATGAFSLVGSKLSHGCRGSNASNPIQLSDTDDDVTAVDIGQGVGKSNSNNGGGSGNSSSSKDDSGSSADDDASLLVLGVGGNRSMASLRLKHTEAERLRRKEVKDAYVTFITLPLWFWLS